MSIDLNDAKKWCETHYDEQLALLKELAAIPAPSNHEERRAEFIRAWLEKIGARDVSVDAALNVRLPFGVDDKCRLHVYMAHTDVVFPDTTPLPVEERDGRLYAPGVGDDTTNAVALMMMTKYILEHGLKERSPLLFVWNSGEEGLGNLKGVRQIMADYGKRVVELISFDAGYEEVYDRAVGSERWRVSVSTIGGHSYGAFGNPNAIHHLSKLICELYDQPVPKKEGTKTTFNVGMIEGGTSVNTIAQHVSMLYEYRSDDKASLDKMHEQFMAAVEAAKCEDAKFETELLGERPCSSDVDPAAARALFDRISAAIENVTGKRPTTTSGSTDANIPLSMGVPALTFGLYDGEGAHTREEHIELASLTPGLKIGMETVLPHFE